MRIIAITVSVASMLLSCGCEGEDASSSSPSAAAAKATAPAAVPASKAIDIVKMWGGFLSEDAAALDTALDALATSDPDSLRAVRYSEATVNGRPGVQLNEYVFELGAPPQTREWYDLLGEEVAAREPAERAALLIRLDSLLAGVMESWRNFESTRPYENAAILRIWCNQRLAGLGEQAADYGPQEKIKQLEALGKRASLTGQIENPQIP